MPLGPEPPEGGRHADGTRRSVVLRLAPSDTSLHRVVTDLVRKRVTIEELHFEAGADTHHVHLVVRAAAAHLDHATAVLRNSIAVVDVVTGSGVAHAEGT